MTYGDIVSDGHTNETRELNLGGVSADVAGRRLAAAMRLPVWWDDVFPPRPLTRRARLAALVRRQAAR